MQTYSHLIITAVLNQELQRQATATQASGGLWQRLPPLKSFPFLLGSVAPDLPLILMGLSAILYDRWRGVPLTHGADTQSATGYLFGYLFFHNPWVKSAHNLFHAPFLILFYLTLGYGLWRLAYGWGAKLFWFASACLLHSAIDIPLHHGDGPLVFFPFDFNTQFLSPVSYYDPDYYGRAFARFEHLLIAGLLLYLGFNRWRSFRKTRTTGELHVNESIITE
jgi:hypothetical protein